MRGLRRGSPAPTAGPGDAAKSARPRPASPGRALLRHRQIRVSGGGFLFGGVRHQVYARGVHNARNSAGAVGRAARPGQVVTVRILIGDVRTRLAELSDESVHCVVTSPPYYGLRDYQVAGQIGLEETPDAHTAQ